MDRRSFLKTLTAGVAVAAAVRTFPFRTYSFPTDLKIVKAEDFSKFVEKMAGRQFEVTSWADTNWRIFPVDIGKPFQITGAIPSFGIGDIGKQKFRVIDVQPGRKTITLTDA